MRRRSPNNTKFPKNCYPGRLTTPRTPIYYYIYILRRYKIFGSVKFWFDTPYKILIVGLQRDILPVSACQKPTPLLVNFGVDMVCVLLPNYEKIVHDVFV
jgi:hypothetical protein